MSRPPCDELPRPRARAGPRDASRRPRHLFVATLLLALAACRGTDPVERRVVPPVLPVGVRLECVHGTGTGLAALVQEPRGVRLILEVRGLAPGAYTVGLATDLDAPVEPLVPLEVDARGTGRLDRQLPGRRLAGEGGLLGRRLVVFGAGGLLVGELARGIEFRSAAPGAPPRPASPVSTPPGGDR